MHGAYYISTNGSEPTGPYTVNQIQAMWSSGTITAQTLAYIESRGTWESVSSLLLPELPTTPPPSILPPAKKKGMGCLGAIATGLGVFFIIGFIITQIANHVETSGTTPTGPHAIDGFYAGQAFIKKDLKAPSTAKFSHSSEEGSFYEIRKDGLYEAGGTVDSQNSFGAMIRNKWRVVLKKEDGNWIRVWMSLGDQKTGPYPEDTK